MRRAVALIVLAGGLAAGGAAASAQVPDAPLPPLPDAEETAKKVEDTVKDATGTVTGSGDSGSGSGSGSGGSDGSLPALGGGSGGSAGGGEDGESRAGSGTRDRDRDRAGQRDAHRSAGGGSGAEARLVQGEHDKCPLDRQGATPGPEGDDSVLAARRGSVAGVGPDGPQALGRAQTGPDGNLEGSAAFPSAGAEAAERLLPTAVVAVALALLLAGAVGAARALDRARRS